MNKKIANQLAFEADAQDRQQWAEESTPWKCVQCGRMHPWYHDDCWFCHPKPKRVECAVYLKELE